MKKRTYRRPNRSPSGYKQSSSGMNSASGTRLGNQLSVSLLLCVFFIASAITGGPTAEKIRLKTSELIGKNALENFQAREGITENISEFVRCMFDSGKENENVTESDSAEDEIASDMLSEKDGDTAAQTPAQEPSSSSADTDDPPPE